MTSTNHQLPTPETRRLPMGIDYVAGHCNLIAEGLGDAGGNMAKPLFDGVVSVAGKFADGVHHVHRVASNRDDYDQAQIGLLLQMSADHNQAPMSCVELRAAGAMHCPKGRNCLRPNGDAVKTPAELVSWAYVRAFEKKTEIPVSILTQGMIDRHYPDGLVFAQDGFWGCEAGAYRKLDLNVEVRHPIMDFLAHDANASRIRAVTEFAKTYAGQSGEYFAENAGRYVCLDNCTLDLQTLDMVPHNPEHRLQTRLNMPWEAEAECPRFLGFLDQVFEPDADKAEKIRFVQQWMGYLITPDVSQQKMVWLVGEGSNGKSVLLDVIRGLIGEQNISAVALSDLSNKFSRAHTAGKTLNICSDLPVKAIADGYIKAMVAGEAIEARGFDQDARTFKTTVRFMASMNTMPQTKDLTDGYFRRIVVLTFNRQFRGVEVNPNLINELLEELPGILRWAVDGLRDLRQETRFSIPPSALAAVQQYQEEVDPVRQFAEQCLRPSADRSGYTGTDLIRVFHAWGRETSNRVEAMTPTAFGRSLRRIGFGKHHSRQDIWLVEPVEAAMGLFARTTAQEDFAEAA